jgi:hypothetical protein
MYEFADSGGGGGGDFSVTSSDDSALGGIPGGAGGGGGVVRQTAYSSNADIAVTEDDFSMDFDDDANADPADGNQNNASFNDDVTGSTGSTDNVVSNPDAGQSNDVTTTDNSAAQNAANAAQNAAENAVPEFDVPSADDLGGKAVAVVLGVLAFLAVAFGGGD